MGKECLASLPKPRKRRTADQEPLRNGSHDEAPAANNGADDNATSRASLPTLGSTVQRSTPPSVASTSNGTGSSGKHFARSLGIESAPGDLLQGVDDDYIRKRFAAFRPMAGHFPFFNLWPDLNPSRMICDRPITTLAICAVSSGARRDHLTRLLHAFRLALSHKVIVNCESSLDLFVALLIFLAWHQNYMAKQQICQMTCLLSGMAADLGLYRQPYQSDKQNSDSTAELNRAFVGCYHLCCSLSVMGFNRPSTLRWTYNLRTCAEMVATSGSQPHDRSLIATLEMTRAVNDLDDLFRAISNHGRTVHTSECEVYRLAVSHRMQALKRDHHVLASLPIFATANIHFQYRALQLSGTPETATLIQCACSIKEYLDDLLSKPAIVFYQMAIIDWISLLEILTTVATIAQPSLSSGGWEVGAISSMLQPHAILDAVCARMASVTATERNQEQLSWFEGLCDNIKKRMLQEKYDGAGPFSNGGVPFDAVRSLGRNGSSSSSGFRPVNQPYASETPLPRAADVQARPAPARFTLFDNGVLGEGLWNISYAD
ncbi:hypothetical protein LTR78_007509 [Recurvomyces mirabilis]|uniref:Uncharacterized protein n=1 Tax=Recurvomyces mirabilis TaxID=574656 RepID=A0AAE0WJ95_9PEZI|nr:hypothetical protein LTR78_007509 [Recurvomyces mirabilis]KAK5159981.1 hypothetical protein LTS14_002087 [Recurvomyces mirabilis]